MMDEEGVRALLEQLASTTAPPPRVDIGRVRRAGGRRLRWYRAGISGAAVLAVIAAVTLVSGKAGSFGLGLRGGQEASGTTGPRQPPASSLPAEAPASFDPLTPSVSFGWLPAGFSASGPETTGEATADSVSIREEAPGGPQLSLIVTSAGACQLTGPQVAAVRTSLPGQSPTGYTSERYPYGLACDYGGGSSGNPPLAGRAPAVQGRPAFWLAPDENGLAWEYAPGGWALVSEGASGANGLPGSSVTVRSELLKVAAGVRYGDVGRPAFPFRLTGLPASWRTADSTFEVAKGSMLGTGLTLGPAADPEALAISVTQAGQPAACEPLAGQTQNVPLDGATGILRTIDEPGKHWQSLCSSDVNGMQLQVRTDLTIPGTSNTPLPGAPADFGAMAVFRELHLLGTNHALWSTSPLS